MIERARMDLFLKPSPDDPGRMAEIYRESAKVWFLQMRDDHRVPFSFEWCCFVIRVLAGVEVYPEDIRKWVRTQLSILRF